MAERMQAHPVLSRLEAEAIRRIIYVQYTIRFKSLLIVVKETPRKFLGPGDGAVGKNEFFKVVDFVGDATWKPIEIEALSILLQVWQSRSGLEFMERHLGQRVILYIPGESQLPRLNGSADEVTPLLTMDDAVPIIRPSEITTKKIIVTSGQR